MMLPASLAPQTRRDCGQPATAVSHISAPLPLLADPFAGPGYHHVYPGGSRIDPDTLSYLTEVSRR